MLCLIIWSDSRSDRVEILELQVDQINQTIQETIQTLIDGKSDECLRALPRQNHGNRGQRVSSWADLFSGFRSLANAAEVTRALVELSQTAISAWGNSAGTKNTVQKDFPE